VPVSRIYLCYCIDEKSQFSVEKGGKQGKECVCAVGKGHMSTQALLHTLYVYIYV
jgi:hypothetical protein